MNNESKLREALLELGQFVRNEDDYPDNDEGDYARRRLREALIKKHEALALATTPIEDGKGNEEIAINISEEWNTDADLRLLIKNALYAKDSAYEKVVADNQRLSAELYIAQEALKCYREGK